MQLLCELVADEAHVPGLWPVAGELLFVRRVAECKTKVGRVRGEPVDRRASGQPQVRHSAKLVLAVARTSGASWFFHVSE